MLVAARTRARVGEVRIETVGSRLLDAGAHAAQDRAKACEGDDMSTRCQTHVLGGDLVCPLGNQGFRNDNAGR